MLILRLKFLSFFLLSVAAAQAQQLIRGKVIAAHDSSAMPFVYIINKSNGNGTMSDSEGRFAIIARAEDTLVSAYIGFLKKEVPVSSAGVNRELLLVMVPLPVNLSEVSVTAFRFKPYERAYMTDVIDRSRMREIDYVTSPITALYMAYSKEGRQIRKLARIFEQILIDENVEKKLNPQILARLTNDESIDYAAFRKYCYYVSDDFIINHDGAELYSRVMDCYRRWKNEQRR
jgi:hypothetical protein